MSVSRTRRLGPTPADVEFKSMDETVEIVPLVKLPVIDSIDGSSIRWGPLVPPQKASVPLWFAIHLKKKRKCRIIVPRWLGQAHLEETLRQELTDEQFSDLPRTYLEVSKVLLEVASDDFPQPDKVRILLKDIREARQSKVRAGLGALNPIHLAMPNLSNMEIAEVRPFFTLAHKRLVLLDPDVDKQAEIEKMWLEKPQEALRRAEMGAFNET
ncbi:DNA replication protein psf2 [Microbotryomycetes sp. JL201]|nr:DNA replication protein psf2 [Microbotryomycetes sp. JL201]